MLWGVFGPYIKGKALVYLGFGAGFFLRNILLRIFTFALNMLEGVVICHPTQEENHNKTTYKLSTATPATSFIDTFFCSIIWAISPVGKDATFYFNAKQNDTLCLCWSSLYHNTCTLVQLYHNTCTCLQPRSAVLTAAASSLPLRRSLTLPALKKRAFSLLQTLHTASPSVR